MTTHRLLAYQRKLMRVHDTPSFGDLGSPSEIRSKADPIWAFVRDNLRSVLSERELSEREYLVKR